MLGSQETDSEIEITCRKFVRNAFWIHTYGEGERRKQGWVEGCGAVTTESWSVGRGLCSCDIVPLGGFW